MAFNPPTRSQISAMAGGDQRMIRALEELFQAVGRDFAGDIEEAQANINALQVSPALPLTQTTMSVLSRVEERSKSNEVLAWLSTQ